MRVVRKSHHQLASPGGRTPSLLWADEEARKLRRGVGIAIADLERAVIKTSEKLAMLEASVVWWRAVDLESRGVADVGNLVKSLIFGNFGEGRRHQFPNSNVPSGNFVNSQTCLFPLNHLPLPTLANPLGFPDGPLVIDIQQTRQRGQRFPYEPHLNTDYSFPRI